MITYILNVDGIHNWAYLVQYSATRLLYTAYLAQKKKKSNSFFMRITVQNTIDKEMWLTDVLKLRASVRTDIYIYFPCGTGVTNWEAGFDSRKRRREWFTSSWSPECVWGSFNLLSIGLTIIYLHRVPTSRMPQNVPLHTPSGIVNGVQSKATDIYICTPT
jgi:hypothetical protein